MIPIKLILIAILGAVLHTKGFEPHEVLGWVSVLVLAIVPEGIV